MATVTIDGRKIYYSFNEAESGEVRPNLILIHGAGGRNIDWPGKMRAMANASVYALDLPGHAKSDGPGHNTIEDYAAFVLAFIDALNLERVVLCGHSMGGAIAQTVALQNPPSVIGIVLVGTGAKMPVSPAILEGIPTNFRKTVAMITKFAWSKSARMEHVFLARRLMLETEPDVLLGDFTACSVFDVRKHLGEIAIPTLVIGGAYDQMMPMKMSQFLVDNIPNAKMTSVDAGHYLMQEKPDDTAQAVEAFCAELG